MKPPEPNRATRPGWDVGDSPAPTTEDAVVDGQGAANSRGGVVCRRIAYNRAISEPAIR
jgi:hypothetical protein